MGAIWEFLTVEENRAVLQWLGGGAMLVCGALWGLRRRGGAPPAPPAGAAAPRPGADLLPVALLLGALLGAAMLALALAGGGNTVEVRDGVGVGGDVSGPIVNQR